MRSLNSVKLPHVWSKRDVVFRFFHLTYKNDLFQESYNFEQIQNEKFSGKIMNVENAGGLEEIFQIFKLFKFLITPEDRRMY